MSTEKGKPFGISIGISPFLQIPFSLRRPFVSPLALVGSSDRLSLASLEIGDKLEFGGKKRRDVGIGRGQEGKKVKSFFFFFRFWFIKACLSLNEWTITWMKPGPVLVYGPRLNPLQEPIFKSRIRNKRTQVDCGQKVLTKHVSIK